MGDFVKKDITIEEIYDVFRSVLELSNDHDLKPSSAFEEVPGWDSLGHMRLIGEFEEMFDIEFEIEEIVDQNTILKIFELVSSKIK